MADGLNVDIGELQSVYDQIVAVDDKLAAASGSDSMGKRAYLNSLVNDRSDSLAPFFEQVVSHIRTNLTDPEDIAAAVTGLDKAVSEAFGKQVDELATTYVEANKKDQPEVSQDEINALENEARELRKKYNALRGVLDMFGFDVTTVPEPKKMSGSRGPRGPRTLSNFDYIVDGKPRTKSQNTLSSIAATVFKDTQFDKAKALREELARQGLDLKNPPDEWEFEIRVNDERTVKLAAIKSEAKDEYVSSDDDDEDEEDENE